MIFFANDGSTSVNVNDQYYRPAHVYVAPVHAGKKIAKLDKAIVDSRLRPQWCFHLANVTEMEEMLDCKLDALIRSFAFEKKRFSCQHKSARIT